MTRMTMYQLAGSLNNHEVHRAVDKVTFMTFMTDAECLAHIEKMKQEIAEYEAGR